MLVSCATSELVLVLIFTVPSPKQCEGLVPAVHMDCVILTLHQAPERDIVNDHQAEVAVLALDCVTPAATPVTHG
jgi:hypothetical protein